MVRPVSACRTWLFVRCGTHLRADVRMSARCRYRYVAGIIARRVDAHACAVFAVGYISGSQEL